jgi:hypothetical protein
VWTRHWRSLQLASSYDIDRPADVWVHTCLLGIKMMYAMSIWVLRIYFDLTRALYYILAWYPRAATVKEMVNSFHTNYTISGEQSL